MEEAETYRHQGFVVIKALFSHAEIDELTKIVDRIHRQWLNENQANYVEQPNNLALHVRIPLLPETGIELIPGTHHRWDTEQEKNVRLELIGHKNSEALPGCEQSSLARRAGMHRKQTVVQSGMESGCPTSTNPGLHREQT